MELKYSEFKNGILVGDLRPIYVFEGDDAYFLNNGAELLKSKSVSQPELNYAEFSGEKLSCQELLASLESYPFMSDIRLTLVREFYPDKKFFDEGLKNYLENPLQESVLAIVNTEKCEALKKYPSVTIVNCYKADEQICAKWIKAECERNGVKIDGECAQLVASYCLSNMARIENETKKLIAYASKSGVIDKSAVCDLVTPDAEHKIYEMTDLIGRKKIGAAVSMINEMLKKGETPQRLLVSVYNYFRRLLHVAISDKTVGELASALKIKEFAVKKAKEQARMFKPKCLKKAVDSLIDIDYKSKSGLIDINEGLWITLFGIMTEN